LKLLISFSKIIIDN